MRSRLPCTPPLCFGVLVIEPQIIYSMCLPTFLWPCSVHAPPPTLPCLPLLTSEFNIFLSFSSMHAPPLTILTSSPSLFFHLPGFFFLFFLYPWSSTYLFLGLLNASLNLFFLTCNSQPPPPSPPLLLSWIFQQPLFFISFLYLCTIARPTLSPCRPPSLQFMLLSLVNSPASFYSPCRNTQQPRLLTQ